jgi:KipI family sensor histidine kinase inhibitor
MKILPASDSSLLVQFGATIASEFHQRVLALFRALLAENDPRIRNLHPAYASLLIDFDPLRLTHAELTAHLRELLDPALPAQQAPPRTIAIPVCYDAEFGPDLADVAAHQGISVDEVIRLHTSPTYLVYFLGFSPGFAYLGGLPPQLRTPRLATPRVGVPAGSVAIAADQTGVYPFDSPGGWRILGRTPRRMFDASANPPTLLQPGDLVKFAAINRSAFADSPKSAEGLDL